MNSQVFDFWIKRYSGMTDTSLIERAKAGFEHLANIDNLLAEAIRRKLDVSGFQSLVSRGLESPGRPVVAGTSKTSEVKKKPAFIQVVIGLFNKINLSKKSTEEDEPEVLSSTKRPSRKNLKLIGVGLGVIVLLVAAYFAVSFLGNRPANPDITFTVPTEVVPVVPTGDSSQPWFSLNPSSSSEAFLAKPVNAGDFISHIGSYWRWFLWVLFFLPMLSLLAQDRFAASEKTDLKAVNLGLAILFALLLFAEPLAGVISWLVGQFDTSVIIEPWILIAIGILVNLAMQWVATTSGKPDYSAFAIAGLFVTGAVLIWWAPANLFMSLLGALMMASGMVLEAYEMNRTHQGWRAILVSLVMLLVFGIGMGVWLLLTSLVTSAPQPAQVVTAKILGFVYWAIYSSRLWVAGLVGLGLAYFLGDIISAKIMGIIRPRAAEMDGYQNQDDRSSRLDITSRFDAMVFGVMLLYPLSYIVWQLIRLFA